MGEIRVTYTSVDRVRKVRVFKSVKGASKFAREWVGDDADVGRTYAVSTDGVGKVEVVGCTLDQLFTY